MTLTQILLTIIAIALSVIAVKVTLSFDINEYLKSRDEKLKGKIRSYCPHVAIKEIDDKIGIQSTFISPSGTLNWICQRCGLQIFHLDQGDESRRLKYFLENPKKLTKQDREFQKLAKKAGFL